MLFFVSYVIKTTKNVAAANDDRKKANVMMFSSIRSMVHCFTLSVVVKQDYDTALAI